MDAIISILASAVFLGTPLLFGTVGEIVTEKNGSLNLGVEGTMAMGAIGGMLLASATNSLFLGILGGMLFGGLCGALFAFLTVTLKANQNVTGLAMTIFGVGLCQFIGQTMDMKGTYPAITDKLLQASADNGIPGLNKIPVIGEILFSSNALTYIGIALAIVMWVYLFRSRSGLRMRAIGENPGAADAVGVRITQYKYLNNILGSAIMGVGGLYMALMVNRGAWNSNWINGYGWISVALVIFAAWSPARAIGGSFLFGIFLALQSKIGVLADAFPTVLGWTAAIPIEIYQMLPFLMTALVIVFTSIGKKKKGLAPAAIGLNYYREDR